MYLNLLRRCYAPLHIRGHRRFFGTTGVVPFVSPLSINVVTSDKLGIGHFDQDLNYPE